jgi:uncharacterized paraquat-inducible protein A
VWVALRDGRVIVLLFRLFFAGTFAFVDHMIDGYKLNSSLPESEKLYDSNFIHFTWTMLLIVVPIFTLLILISCGCFCFLEY